MQAEDCVADLYRLLPYLRQALSCCVCGNLLRRPCGPEPNVCQHFVCSNCVGGKMNLKPSCSWCKDPSLFAENTQIWILVHCFKKLCEYLNNSRFMKDLQPTTEEGETNGLALLVQEAINFEDDYSSSIDDKLSTIPSLTTFSLKRKQKPSSDSHNTDTCLKTSPLPTSPSPSTTTSYAGQPSLKQEPVTARSPTVTTSTAITEQWDRLGETPVNSLCKGYQNSSIIIISSNSSCSSNNSNISPSNKRETVSKRKKRSLWNNHGEVICLTVDDNDNDDDNDDDDDGGGGSEDGGGGEPGCKKFCPDNNNNNNRKSNVDSSNSQRSSWSGIYESVHKHRLISTSGHS
ncbi:uncharacterized protein LOC106875393 [Argonauta hians]